MEQGGHPERLLLLVAEASALAMSGRVLGHLRRVPPRVVVLVVHRADQGVEGAEGPRVDRLAADRLRPHGHRVAAPALGLVEVRVGHRDQGRGILAVLGKRGRAEAHAQRDAGAVRGDVRQRGQRVAHMVGDRLGVGAVGLGEDEHELVPAEAGHEVGSAAPVAEDFGHAPDDLVAQRMPVRVVEELEVVDVGDQHRELALVALGPRDLHLELLERPPPVEEPAERIHLARGP